MPQIRLSFFELRLALVRDSIPFHELFPFLCRATISKLEMGAVMGFVLRLQK